MSGLPPVRGSAPVPGPAPPAVRTCWGRPAVDRRRRAGSGLAGRGTRGGRPVSGPVAGRLHRRAPLVCRSRSAAAAAAEVAAVAADPVEGGGAVRGRADGVAPTGDAARAGSGRWAGSGRCGRVRRRAGRLRTPRCRARCRGPAAPAAPAPGAREPPDGGAPGDPGAPGGRRPPELDRPRSGPPASAPTGVRRPRSTRTSTAPATSSVIAISSPGQSQPRPDPDVSSAAVTSGTATLPCVPDAVTPEAARCLAMARFRLARKCPGKSSSALVKPGTEAANPPFLNRCIAASKLVSTGPPWGLIARLCSTGRIEATPTSGGAALPGAGGDGSSPITWPRSASTGPPCHPVRATRR